MKKNYSSPSLEVVIVESDTMLLAGSGSDEDEKDPIDKVTIDGNGTLITDGGETETETEYNPW